MTRHDDQDDRPTLLETTQDGQQIRVGDPSPTRLDTTQDGQPIYRNSPQSWR